jgi:glutamyl-tRNA synthetase
VQDYRAKGFLASAMLNWLARMGWSHGDQEVFSRDEIVALFELEKVHRSPAQADAGKLAWLNQHYLKTLPRPELLATLLPFLAAEAGRERVEITPELEKLVDLLRERSKTLPDLAERARFALREEVAWDEAAFKKHLNADARPVLETLRKTLAALGDWREPALEGAFEAARKEHGDLPLGKLAQPVRVAVTGSAASPPIFETLRVLGRERTLRRLDEALARHAG